MKLIQYTCVLTLLSLYLGFWFLHEKDQKQDIRLKQIEELLDSLPNADFEAFKNKEVNCLAKNIYHEARGTSTVDQIRVAQVTLNRVNSGKFPNTVCETVYQPYQFSWTIRNKNKPIKEKKAWEKALLIAEKAINYQYPDYSKGADHYFNPDKAQPRWQSAGKVVSTSGAHTLIKMY